MELFGTHWPPGTANKTRMMIRERWIPSLQQKMPPLNLQHHCNLHLLCCHSNTKIVAPIDCASESITDGPRYCHPSLHLSPLLHCTMQCTSITMSCTCQHTHTRSVQQLTTSYFNTHCNIRTRPSVLLLTQATHALPLSSKPTAIIHRMPDNIHQQGQGSCNQYLRSQCTHT
jgi:hypothetical protein